MNTKIIAMVKDSVTNKFRTLLREAQASDKLPDLDDIERETLIEVFSEATEELFDALED